MTNISGPFKREIHMKFYCLALISTQCSVLFFFPWGGLPYETDEDARRFA